MYTVYILYSDTLSQYYTGHTKDFKQRLIMHNNKKVKSTKAGVPWKVIYTEEYQTKSEAYRREMKIKSYKGGQEFKKLFID